MLNQRGFSEFDKELNFDWNDYRTFATADKVIKEQSTELPLLNLSAEDKAAVPKYYYKIGTFYLHVKRNAEISLNFLQIAEEESNGLQKAWALAQLSFVYQKLYVATKNDSNEEIARKNLKVAKFYSDKALETCKTLPTDKATDLEVTKIIAFVNCVNALIHYETDNKQSALTNFKNALNLYEKIGLYDDQYARAKNRYAQILAELKQEDLASKIFSELNQYWEYQDTVRNPYAGRFYESYAEFVNQIGIQDNFYILDLYLKAKQIYAENKEEAAVTRIQTKLDALQNEILKTESNHFFEKLQETLTCIPSYLRPLFIENMTAMFVHAITPMSGLTLQQTTPINENQLTNINSLVHYQPKFENNSDPRFAYYFAREATSAGVLPAYRDSKTGEIYVALVCNKRNLSMYNWSAGYTEAPYPKWNGPLLSSQNQAKYNANAVKQSAQNTMLKLLNEAQGDWLKVKYDAKRFAAEFKNDNVQIPKADLNSLQTAERECLEEINLDLTKYPGRKTFLISYDNTVGISQGDAPGQLSNRSHQYLVYLGDLSQAPTLKAGGDVAIADWVNVKNITRNNASHYVANNKSLCVYMLQGLENGLQQLWNYLLQEKTHKRFSEVDNVLGELNYRMSNFDSKQISYVIPTFIQSFNTLKTRTGAQAQRLLQRLLNVAGYLQNNNDVFGSSGIEQIINSLPERLYNRRNAVTHFVASANNTNPTAEIDAAIEQAIKSIK